MVSGKLGTIQSALLFGSKINKQSIYKSRGSSLFDPHAVEKLLEVLTILKFNIIMIMRLLDVPAKLECPTSAK
jgi:hypothetical protein